MSIGELLCVRSSEVFSVYPRLLKEILEQEKPPIKLIILPSDFEWKQKVYFYLLEQQKLINAAIDRGEPLEEIRPKKEQWDPQFSYENLLPIPNSDSTPSRSKQRCVADEPINFVTDDELNLWNLDDIAKAGKLLHTPPIACEFFDEQEMRRVYSLIYDVYRYKLVLNQALKDISFYGYFPELLKDTTRVWLLLFDMNLRHFSKRDPEETARKDILFAEANLLAIEKCLWDHRIKLAAAISRLRIRNSALRLSQLLPLHLQDEKVAIAAANPIVSGWMNPFRKRTNTLARKSLESVGFMEVEEDDGIARPLAVNHFKFDKVCPQFVSCIPQDRSSFAQCPLIKNYDFIMQDRTFSLGPAIFSRLLDFFELEGNIIQTHISSPKATAYLASLFLSNNRVEKFHVFGAGAKKPEYDKYFDDLRVSNVELHAENFCDLPKNTEYFERVVGILCSPPNSYSGVCDPIDLICSRGGDLGMLEVMTESEISKEAKCRVAEVLKEQRTTLKLAMSRPQVQFILYETHSVIDSENSEMVQSVIDFINQEARKKHIEAERERIRLEELAALEAYQIPFVQQTTPTSSRRKVTQGESKTYDDKTKQNEEEEFGYVVVPPTDEYEFTDLPDVCINQDRCISFEKLGCYFALIKRKEIICADARYMIKIAESRGVFGSVGSKSKTKIKTAKKVEKKEEVVEERQSRRLKRRRSDLQLVLDRLSQPTHSFLSRSHLQRLSSAEKKIIVSDSNRFPCQRHQDHHQEDSAYSVGSRQNSTARQWWHETAQYMQTLHELNGRDKISMDSIKSGLRNKKFPPLRLSRADGRYEYVKREQLTPRHPYPLPINDVQFQDYRHLSKYYPCPLVDGIPNSRACSIPNDKMSLRKKR